jgi:ectoine hydroxylase-related dioxygenase (phytanoyl-CoA dioxygenase family)
MRNVFSDPLLEAEFQREGFVVVDFISSDEVEHLKQKFFELLPESGGNITASDSGFDTNISYDFTFIDKNIDFKRKVFDEISGRFKTRMDAVLDNYSPIIANYIRKTPDSGEVPLHENWAFADEKKCSTVSIWCPLVDATVANGTLQVVPGSHKRFGEVRGPMVPWELEDIRQVIVDKYLKPIEISAGKAVILDDSIVHYSAPNRTPGLRLAIQLICVPQEFPSIHHHMNPADAGGKVKVLEVDTEFYMNFNPWQFPVGLPELGTINYTHKLITEAAFASRLYGKRFDEEKQSPKMKPLFKNPEHQSFFEKNGFVKFPMLDETAVTELRDFFHSQGLRDHSGYGFNMSMEDDDKEKVARIRKKIFDVALPQALPHFADAKVIAGSFVVKEKNPQGVVPPHQDWSFVEKEGENCSVTCWIPLVPTNMKNGFMGVIKGSHLMLDNKRPSPSPQVPTPLMNHLFSIFPYLEMYEMQPGEALIFDHRTFHASTPNITDDPRIAIGLGFTQADSEICHYNLKLNGKKDTLLKYRVDDEFLLKYDNSKLSRMYDAGETIQGYEVVEELPYVCPDLSTDELLKQIKDAGNVFNVELAEHMAKLFNYNMDGSKTESKEEAPNPISEVQVDMPPQEGLPSRSFWEVYTPLNVVREIRYRITGS